VGGGFETWDLAATAQGLRTDGFSAAATGTEDDGYRNVTLSAAGSVDLGETLTLGGAARYIDRETEIDRVSRGIPVDAIGDTSASEVIAGRAFARHRAFDDRLVNEVSVQRLASTREFDQQTAGFSRFEGDRLKLEWLGTFAAADRVDLLAGADWTREEVETGDGLEADSEIAGGFAQIVLAPVDALTLTGALRRDEHSEFGGFTTWRATAAWEALEGTTLRGAVGTGFRAPSNRELFSPPGVFGPVGNPDLQPEETFSWEVGIDQSLANGRARASATWFDARTDELIAFVFGTGYAQIPGESRRSGVELGLEARATEWLDLSAAYTYLEAEDPDGRRLDFAPRHDARIGAVARPVERVTLAASASYVSGVRDGGEALDPFLLVNATAAYAPTEGVEAYLRVENAFDQDYERVDGYATSGIAAYAGLRARF
jgi:vitamin B12 transporter